jgi:hypothetical protein
MEMKMSEKETDFCEFFFMKNKMKVKCGRQSVMELDGKKFCKLHSEVYILENFDVTKDLKKSASG